jgi:hypothetical protein
LLESLESGLQVNEVELKAQVGRKGLEDSSAGGDDFLSDAIAGD